MPRGAIRGYRDLEIWQRAMDLVVESYQLSARFPVAEQFGLTSQLRRSAASIPSNIAEGHGRGKTAEYAHFLRIAHGSLMELETQLQIAERLGYLGREESEGTLSRTRDLGRMINGLVSRLHERLATPIPDP